MSKNLKILLAVFGVALVVVVVLNMFNKPPKLPLGPIVGLLAADEVVDTAPAPAPAGGIIDPATGLEVICAPVAGAAAPAPGAGAVDPVTGAPAAGAPAGTVDPATGAPAGTANPATSAPAGTVDPATGAPVAAEAEGWSSDARVTAAGGAYDGSRISDTRIIAAEAAVNPAMGVPAGTVDPAMGAPAATVDPATGTQAAVPVTTDAGATDPTTGLPADPAAGAAATANPCPPGQEPSKDVVGGDAAAGGAAAGGADPAAGAAGAGAGAGVAATSTKATTDGTNTGNSPEALRAAKDATGVMQKAKIQVSTTATLVPSVGGTARPAALRRYRASVTAAVLVMKLDAAAQQQWTGAGKKVQIDLVKSFLVRLRKSYPKAARSITVVNADGNVLAIGDAVAGGGAGTVKLF